jgi:non-ribosomal peptide synthase protein (TIGR01720 family)
VTGSGFRIPEALLAALTLAVAGVFGPQRFAVELEGHGREERETALDISRSVGWFTTLYPVVLELPSTDSFESMIAAVRDQLRSVPSGGFGYGLLRWLDPAAAARLSLREPAGVLFNYLGQTSTPGATAAGFRLCDMSAGDEHSPDQPMSHALTVNARIRDERLCVDFATSRRVMSETLLDVLAAAFEARLSAIPAAGGALRDFENAVADQESLLEEIEL